MLRLVVIAATLMLGFASYANAGQSGDYAEISVGMSLTKDAEITDREGSKAELNLDNGIPVSAFIGRQYKNGVRVDGELFFKNFGAKELSFAGQKSKVDVNAWFLGAMGNVYYNFYHDLEDEPYSPYVGLGAGFANVHLSGGADNRFAYWNGGDEMVFAYQGILGFNVPLRKNFVLDASYRYFRTTDLSIDSIKTNIDSHNILVGIRYFFR